MWILAFVLHWVKIKVYMDLWYKWYPVFSQPRHLMKTCNLNSWNIMIYIVHLKRHSPVSWYQSTTWTPDQYISQQLVECRSSVGWVWVEYQYSIRQYVGRHLSDTWLTYICWRINWHSTNYHLVYQSSIGQVSTNTQPTYGPSIGWYIGPIGSANMTNSMICIEHFSLEHQLKIMWKYFVFALVLHHYTY